MQRKVNNLLDHKVTRCQVELESEAEEREDVQAEHMQDDTAPKAKKSEDRKVLFHDSKAMTFAAKAEKSRE